MTAKRTVTAPANVARPSRARKPKPPKPEGPPGCGYVKWVLVTPAIAEEWLEGNTSNRALRNRKEERMCGAATAGKWGLNPQVIIIDWDKVVVDGQHRLWMVVLTGIPQWFLVVFDIDPICRDYVDTGDSKTVGDLLNMRGVPEPNSVAALAKLTWAYDNIPGELWHSHQYPDKEFFREAAVEHQELMGKAALIGKKMTRELKLFPRSLMTALYLILRDSKNLDENFPEFIRGITEGTDLSHGDPRLAIRRLGLTRKIDWDTGAAPREQQEVALVLKGWNLWVTEKTVTYLRWHSRDLPLPRAR